MCACVTLFHFISVRGLFIVSLTSVFIDTISSLYIYNGRGICVCFLLLFFLSVWHWMFIWTSFCTICVEKNLFFFSKNCLLFRIRHSTKKTHFYQSQFIILFVSSSFRFAVVYSQFHLLRCSHCSFSIEKKQCLYLCLCCYRSGQSTSIGYFSTFAWRSSILYEIFFSLIVHSFGTF